MSTLDQTRKYYDKHADFYDLKTGFGSQSGQEYNFRNYYEPFLARVVPAAGKILELGCGTGFYTSWLAQRGLEVVAMDISAKMIEQTELRCPQDVSLLVGNCEDPASVLESAITTEGFAAIVGVNTFSYYPHKLKALENYRRLLRDGGRLILLDMNGTSFTQRLAYIVNLRGARKFAENVDESTPEKLTALLEKAGFTVEEMQRFTFVPNGVNKAGVVLFSLIDRVFKHVPLANALAIRLSAVAVKV